MRHPIGILCSLPVVLLTTQAADAALTQPDQTEPIPWCNVGGFTTCEGKRIECANGNVEGCIIEHEGIVRGGIDIVEDAQIANETFLPRRACDQKVTYLFEGTWGASLHDELGTVHRIHVLSHQAS